MTRSRYGNRAALGAIAAVAAMSLSLAVPALAETAFAGEGATGSFLKTLSERLAFTISQIPALGAHLASLTDIVGQRTALLLLGIVAAGLAAEYIARLLLSRARIRVFDRLVHHSPLRAFGFGLLFDLA